MTLKMKLAGAAVALVMAAGVAHAQDASYDGYCYAKKSDAKTTGTIVGAVLGGALGSQISKNERGLGTVGGAVVGGALGRSIGSNSVKCMNGEYYSYQTGYYTPPAAPDGYDVVYYKTRPDASTYSTVYYDRDRHTTPQYAYNQGYNNGYNNGYSTGSNGGYTSTSYNSGTQGWRDDAGNWHSGRPVALGWKDSRGRWHEGQMVAYGWQDSGGMWHQTSTAPSYGYNSTTDDSGYNGYDQNGYGGH